jgi:hypothetical protein
MTQNEVIKLELEAVKKMLELGAGEFCPELAAKLEGPVATVER